MSRVRSIVSHMLKAGTEGHLTLRCRIVWSIDWSNEDPFLWVHLQEAQIQVWPNYSSGFRLTDEVLVSIQAEARTSVLCQKT